MAVEVERSFFACEVQNDSLVKGDVGCKSDVFAGIEFGDEGLGISHTYHFVVGFVETGFDFDIDVEGVGQQATVDIGAEIALYGHVVESDGTFFALGALDAEADFYSLLFVNQQIVHGQVVIFFVFDGHCAGCKRVVVVRQLGFAFDSTGHEVELIGHVLDYYFSFLGGETGSGSSSYVIGQDVELCKRTIQFGANSSVSGHLVSRSVEECIKRLVVCFQTFVVGFNGLSGFVKAVDAVGSGCKEYEVVFLAGGQLKGDGSLQAGHGSFADSGIGAAGAYCKGFLLTMFVHGIGQVCGGSAFAITGLETFGQLEFNCHGAFCTCRFYCGLFGGACAKHQHRCDGCE